MALRVESAVYHLAPRLTTLATGTTLAASTRYDAAAKTIKATPNSSRVFRSAKVVVKWRDAHAATTSNVVGVRIGIKLGAVAFSDLDIIPTALANTGDHEANTETRDVTAYFVSNFGAADTQTCQVGVAISTATASLVNNVTIMLIITYEFDDTGATNCVKTVPILIQGHHALLTAAQQEIGTTGGTNNAAVNQIPQLTGVGGLLKEASVTILDAFITVAGNDAGAATTDFSFVYQIDVAAEVTHVAVEQALNTGVMFETIITYDTTTFSTASAHAFKARSTLASRFDSLGAVLWVTYECDPSTSTAKTNALIYAVGGSDPENGYIGGTVVADSSVYECNVWIQEPNPAILRAGVQLWVSCAAGGTLRAIAGTAPERSYTMTALVEAGGQCVHHRCDVGAGSWTLARGLNQLALKLYTTGLGVASLRGGFAYLVYSSDVSSQGFFAHNHTTFWSIDDKQVSGAAATVRETLTTNQRTPIIPETNYFLTACAAQCYARNSQGSVGFGLFCEELAGEDTGDGWKRLGMGINNGDSEMSTLEYVFPLRSRFRRTDQDTDGLNIETARKYRVHSNIATHAWISGLWVTHHSITFSVSGNVTGGTPSGTVEVWDTTDLKRVASVAAAASYTATVYDNTRTYFPTLRESGTLLGRGDNGTPTGTP
jgi:hypothetical protein